MTKFYIIRHGESESNAAHREGLTVTSGPLGSDLTEKGVQQVEERSQEFRAIHFDAVFSSDLLRAKRTAEIIALQHQLTVVTNENIRETNAASFHKLNEEKRKEMKELIEKLSEEEKFVFRLGDNMETYEEAATRLLTFIREVAIAYANKTVGIVVHGSLMKAFLIKLGEGTPSEYPSGSIENTGYIIVESDGIEFFVKGTKGIHRKEISS